MGTRHVGRGIRPYMHRDRCAKANYAMWQTWRDMVKRCHNPAHQSYRHYGGRGITVCDEWRESFRAFLLYMGPKPTSEHSLDRINNDGNYEPGNVRWATRSEQARNRRRKANPPGTLSPQRDVIKTEAFADGQTITWLSCGHPKRAESPAKATAKRRRCPECPTIPARPAHER